MNFEKLLVWKKAHKLTISIYNLTEVFPKKEIYGLVSQLRRAAVSIPTNIVEGNSRRTKKDFLNFLYIARSSLEEVKYLSMLSKDLGYIKDEDYDMVESDLDEIGKLLFGLIKNTRDRT